MVKLDEMWDKVIEMQIFGCCGSRNHEQRLEALQNDTVEKANDPMKEQEKEETAIGSWRLRSDDTHTILAHSKNGLILELLHGGSKGWFHCRTADWKMYTVYSDGHTHTPRVQVFDAEHLIGELRHNSFENYLRLPNRPMGNWILKANEDGNVLITHLRQPAQLLVLVATGFVFIGTDGNAILVDDAGVHQLAAHEVNSMFMH